MPALFQRLPVVLRKAASRLEPDSSRSAHEWAASRATSVTEYCGAMDPTLWQETTCFASRLRHEAEQIIGTLPPNIGGGGAFDLVYFLVRHLRPRAVVETGVAAGWTSAAALAGIEANGVGQLFSSDFPYLRIRDANRVVGALVPLSQRQKWHLDTRGDRVALPAILDIAGDIGLFHYDSDKSSSGRRFAMRLVTPRMADGGYIIMDDIQDNMFFAHWVASSGRSFAVVSVGEKFAGVVRW